jgi:hypothetical protein
VPDKVGLGGDLHRLCRVGEDFALLEGGGEKAGLGGERWGASSIRGRPFPVSWRVSPGDGPWEGDGTDSSGGGGGPPVEFSPGAGGARGEGLGGGGVAGGGGAVARGPRRD